MREAERTEDDDASIAMDGDGGGSDASHRNECCIFAGGTADMSANDASPGLHKYLLLDSFYPIWPIMGEGISPNYI